MDAVDLDELADERRDARADASVVGADEGGAAERGVSASAQVQVAGPYAARGEMAHAEHVRGQASRGTHALERRHGRVQLLDRGRRAQRGGAFGEQRLFGRQVIDVGARARSGERELAGQVGLQARQAARGARRAGPRTSAHMPGCAEDAQQGQYTRRRAATARRGDRAPSGTSGALTGRPGARARKMFRAWARLSSWNRPRRRRLRPRSGLAGSRRAASDAPDRSTAGAGRGATRPRSCSAAAGSPGACMRSARCARSTCSPSTAPSTSSTSTWGPRRGRSSRRCAPTA